VNAGRSRALTGKSRLAKLQAAYEQVRGASGLPATWQVVYAVAWVPASGNAPRGETHIGLDAVRASLGLRR
jgi:malonyl-CoA O-methyltransferase